MTVHKINKRMKMDTNVHNQPETHPPKCYYCGQFIGKKDDWEMERIYGFMSPDCDVFYHKKCKYNDTQRKVK